jgi:C4-dicarboxylate-specific signal transduction histidine kinase
VKHQEVALAGRITADQTHEIKNALAVLRESVGVMRDVLNLSKDLDFQHKERFERALGFCEKHLSRGVAVTSRLNRFAHSSDEPEDEVDLRQATELAVELMARRASFQKIVVEAKVPSKPITLRAFPQRVILLISAMVNALLEAELPGVEKILVSLESKKSRVFLRAMAAPWHEGLEGKLNLPDVNEAMAELGAALSYEAGRKTAGLVLDAPI